MKEALFCRWFGHKFVGIKQRLEGYKSITTTVFTNNCANCGLSKEDLLTQMK